jgi:hypothetical protein
MMVRGLLVLLVLFMAAACAPTTLSHGVRREIVIAEHISPRVASVQVLDEVRWVNQREGSVTLVLLDGDEDSLTCHRGFGHAVIAATLDPNESASVCFARSGTFRYTIRLDRAFPGEPINVLGVIEVGAGSQQDDRRAMRVGEPRILVQ